MQRARQNFDARAVRVDDAFAAHAHAGGKRGGFEQPADGVVQRGRKPSRSAGVSMVREARMAPCSSTMPALICAPPISMPSTTANTQRAGSVSDSRGFDETPLNRGCRLAVVACLMRR